MSDETTPGKLDDPSEAAGNSAEHAEEIKQHDAVTPTPRGGDGGRSDDDRLTETPPPHPS